MIREVFTSAVVLCILAPSAVAQGVVVGVAGSGFNGASGYCVNHEIVPRRIWNPVAGSPPNDILNFNSTGLVTNNWNLRGDGHSCGLGWIGNAGMTWGGTADPLWSGGLNFGVVGMTRQAFAVETPACTAEYVIPCRTGMPSLRR